MLIITLRLELDAEAPGSAQVVDKITGIRNSHADVIHRSVFGMEYTDDYGVLTTAESAAPKTSTCAKCGHHIAWMKDSSLRGPLAGKGRWESTDRMEFAAQCSAGGPGGAYHMPRRSDV